jgi:energy-coupling factor transporter ATP-binding protein EcfA2
VVNTIPQSVRTADNLLTTWNKYVEPLHAHSIFKQWGGLSLISAALTRRVWFRTTPVMPALFPNLFVLLCGPPGSGKDLIINTIRDLLSTATEGMEQQQGVNIGPESLSTKGLIDALADDESRLTFNFKSGGKTETVHIHSLFIVNGELGAFMPEYQTQMISIINDLFNCKNSFTERVRGRNGSAQVKIENPHLTMLLGTQPAVFARIVPEEAFQMGFTARLIICNAHQVARKPFFNNDPVDTTLEGKIISDLRALALLAGEYKPTKHFKEKLNDFHLRNPGAIEHSRFQDYNVRRSLHVGKIAMCCAAAESNELILDENHFDQALEYLTLSEKAAPTLFDDLITSQGFHHTVEQVLHTKVNSTITHAELERKLRKTHKPHEVGQIIRSMIQSNDIVFAEYRGTMPIYNVLTEVK